MVLNNIALITKNNNLTYTVKEYGMYPSEIPEGGIYTKDILQSLQWNPLLGIWYFY